MFQTFEMEGNKSKNKFERGGNKKKLMRNRETLEEIVQTDQKI